MADEKNNPSQKSHSQQTNTSNITTSSFSGHSTATTKKKRKKKKKHGKKAVVKNYGPPVKEYLSLCHGAPAKKPRAGSPLQGKNEDDPTQVNGLGGWKCGECNRPCKVSPRKPQAINNEVNTVI